MRLVSALTTVLAFSCMTFSALAQSGADAYPKDYFRSPLGIPISLSGNFGEMRSNHYHTGLDIRTNGQPGYRVYAAAQGSIVRIAVSGGGYGNALYMQHPNGYQTVYAHLDRFEEPLASYVRQQQYAQQSFEVNLFPQAGRFRFEQGDVIGYSGNSGSSGGPHLHFEIRDAAHAEPLNPLLFGLPVVDTTRPRAYRIKVYATNPTSSAALVDAAGDTLRRALPWDPAAMGLVEVGAGAYELDAGAHIAARGQIAFAVHAHDYHDNSGMRLGLYTVDLRAGQELVYQSKMERLNFGLQRYINAHLDFQERTDNGRWVQRSHVLPGNAHTVHRAPRNGILDVEPGDVVPMRYELTDAYGNMSVVSFSVRGAALPMPPPPQREGFFIDRQRPESVVMPGIIVRVPAGALYEDVVLLYSSEDGPSGAYSPQHNVHSSGTPLHQSITVSIEPDSLPAELREKALVARVSTDGLSSAGGSYNSGYVTTSTRSFGSFVVAADTSPPTIRPVNISPGASMSRQASIRIQISDDLSGIQSYEGRVDGRWVLFEHDPKNSLIWYDFDDRVGPGRHELTLRVQDGKGNVSTFNALFSR